VTFYSPNGWLRSGPVKDGDLLGLLTGLKRMGFKHVEFDGGSTNSPEFDQSGLSVLSIEAGLPEPPSYDLAALKPGDVFIQRHTSAPGDPPPCQMLADGSGVYAEVSNPLSGPFDVMRFVCPGRNPPYYRRTAPVPESVTHVITGRPRAIVLGLFGALRRAGIRSVEFDPTMITSYMEPIGLQALAATVGLTVPGVNNPGVIAAHQAYLLLHIPARGDAPPCVRMPDGSGVYMVLHDAVIPFDQYTFYCPLRRPPLYRRPGG
jgi:hypothetical protein